MVPKMSHVFTADTLQRVPCRPPRGRPEPQVWWERGGQRVPTEGRVYQDGLDLVFSPTQGDDSGSYTCVAENKAGKRTQEVTFTVASKSVSVASIYGHRLYFLQRLEEFKQQQFENIFLNKFLHEPCI